MHSLRMRRLEGRHRLLWLMMQTGRLYLDPLVDRQPRGGGYLLIHTEDLVLVLHSWMAFPAMSAGSENWIRWLNLGMRIEGMRRSWTMMMISVARQKCTIWNLERLNNDRSVARHLVLIDWLLPNLMLWLATSPLQSLFVFSVTPS